MSNLTSSLSSGQAQVLMSQLMDGEISPTDAALLEEFLQKNPDTIDWMQSLDTVRAALSTEQLSNTDNEKISQNVIEAIEAQPKTTSKSHSSKLISFPTWLRSVAAAAAVALIGIVSWTSLKDDSILVDTEQLAFQGSEVQFVSTDIPDANPVVYTDNETGWTVIWVESMPPIPEEA